MIDRGVTYNISEIKMVHKCIYCGNANDLSESDIIPDALTNARILNRNVCRVEHNNKFSDMFESKVIEALSFITNELDIKSSKGKNYASYEAIITIDGTDYNLKLRGDNEIFNGRVLKSTDSTQMISTYDKAVKIAKDESKVDPLDVNTVELEKKVKINNEIFFDIAMYRMLSKIAYEWFCSKNNISEYYNEFEDIVKFITTGTGTNPVSIIQEIEIYKMIDFQVNLGSHVLLAFEKNNGEIDVIIYLFGLLIYRVIVTKNKPDNCSNNFLYTELRTDSSRRELIHHSLDEAQQKFFDILAPENYVSVEVANSVPITNFKIIETIPNFELYPILFNLIKYFTSTDEDAIGPNEKVNDIFLNQLKNIIQLSTLQKNSIKRFVNEKFYEGHEKIRLNPQSSNKKATILFYSVYLIGLSQEICLDDRILQKILKAGLDCAANAELIVDDEMENKIKNIMMSDKNYSEILEKGAEKVKNWKN